MFAAGRDGRRRARAQHRETGPCRPVHPRIRAPARPRARSDASSCIGAASASRPRGRRPAGCPPRPEAGVGHGRRRRSPEIHQTHMAKTSSDGPRRRRRPGDRARARRRSSDAKAPGSQSAKRVPAAHVPTPGDLAVTGAGRRRRASTARPTPTSASPGPGSTPNTNFSTEPPDQALCVGNGFVVQGVNALGRASSRRAVRRSRRRRPSTSCSARRQPSTGRRTPVRSATTSAT